MNPTSKFVPTDPYANAILSFDDPTYKFYRDALLSDPVVINTLAHALVNHPLFNIKERKQMTVFSDLKQVVGMSRRLIEIKMLEQDVKDLESQGLSILDTEDSLSLLYSHAKLDSLRRKLDRKNRCDALLLKSLVSNRNQQASVGIESDDEVQHDINMAYLDIDIEKVKARLIRNGASVST